eukprot:gene36094-46190_t
MIGLTYTAYYLAFVPKGAVLAYNRVGDYSYGIYIYAFPMPQIQHQFPPNLSPLQHMACAAPVVLIASIASWHGLERRALALARPLSERMQRLSVRPVTAPAGIRLLVVVLIAAAICVWAFDGNGLFSPVGLVRGQVVCPGDDAGGCNYGGSIRHPDFFSGHANQTGTSVFAAQNSWGVNWQEMRGSQPATYP